MTQGILCFPSRLALRWSVFKLRTHFKFFPFYLKNMMMFWCHAELTRTFNCVNLCVFMFTQVCFIPLCQIFMHMKPSFVSAGCVWISRGQNVSSLLSYRRAASKMCVCVFVCVHPGSSRLSYLLIWSKDEHCSMQLASNMVTDIIFFHYDFVSANRH